jgi:hypothetical protein
MSSKVRRVLELTIPLLILFSAAIAYYPVLRLYHSEAERTKTPLVAGDAEHPDHLTVQASVLAVDPAKNEMSVRLQFEPQGALVAGDKFSLTRDLTLYVDCASGSQERVFKKGKPMSPTDVTIGLYDGFPTEYPFDTYEADLDVLVSSSTKQGDESAESIPVVTELTTNVPGFRVQPKVDPKSLDGGAFVSIDVARSATTVFFAVFVMIAMWLLALSVLSWALAVLIRGRRIEATLFGWVGAMLFAFPALRNAVPGAPPIGCMSDFVAFFWAEGIVMFSLVVLVYCYLSRPLK